MPCLSSISLVSYCCTKTGEIFDIAKHGTFFAAQALLKCNKLKRAAELSIPKNNTSMRKIFITTLLLLLGAVCAESQRHYTVVISLDGYRWDYAKWHNTPFMDMMASKGVDSGLIPSYPSKTFPNHYTLATGLYPDHHGIIANDFYDSTTGDSFSLSDAKQKNDAKYYGGEPIWNTAKRQGLKTAAFYWPASDVCVGGCYPDTYYAYDSLPRLTMTQRLDGVIGQLSLPTDKRPDLIMCYLEEPDATGHNFGPQSKHTRKMVEHVDSLLMSFYNKLRKLSVANDVNLIVLSDHGMTWVAKGNNVPIGHLLKKEWTKKIEGSIPANIYVESGCQDSVCMALQSLPHATVWKKDNIPARFHYGTNSRVGDVVVNPDLGYLIQDEEAAAGGAHGFDNGMNDMHALFRAIGPDFKHIKMPHFANVDVYALLCHLLGIKESANDGNISEISDMLR